MSFAPVGADFNLSNIREANSRTVAANKTVCFFCADPVPYISSLMGWLPVK